MAIIIPILGIFKINDNILISGNILPALIWHTEQRDFCWNSQMIVDKSIKYYTEQQVSHQWRNFIGAMGAEFGAQLNEDDLRKLMARIGMRFADSFDVSQCTTLDELQQSVNQFWADLDWGWVEFSESEDLLDIRHLCSPLRAAFGVACFGWTPAFLEGVYQRWFDITGIDPSLRVQQVESPDTDNQLIFKLSRV